MLVTNPLIHAEVSVRFERIEELDAALPPTLFRRDGLPWQAGFLAGKCFLAYRRAGGSRRSPLPDFCGRARGDSRPRAPHARSHARSHALSDVLSDGGIPRALSTSTSASGAATTTPAPRSRYSPNRYYDPATGWFTQQDPIGLAGGLDLHGYAGGDPINFDDPFGLCPWWISAFGGAQRCQNASSPKHPVVLIRSALLH